MRRKEALELLSGPFGVELNRFPLKFAAPIMVLTGLRDQAPTLNSGTISLVQLGPLCLGVTCAHVLRPFREAIHDGLHSRC